MSTEKPSATSLRPNDVLRLEDSVVLIVGDVMLDSYLDGTVTRVSPEAPVPVMHARAEHTVLGGAANVAANLVGLGGRALLVGIFGDDARGDQLLDLCRTSGVELLSDLRQAGRATVVKQRIVSGNQQLIRIDWEEYVPTRSEDSVRLGERLERLIRAERVNCIVLSDYAKGTITPSLAQEVILAARRLDVPVVVDPKGVDLERYSGASVIKPNIGEARTCAGLGADATSDQLASVLHRLTDVDYFVISMARDGVAIFPRSGGSTTLRSHVVEVADVSGAGDTMIATIAAGLGTGLSLRSSVELGNIAAGLACTHFGTHVVTAAELLPALLREDRSANSPHIVRDWAALRELVEVHRRSGARIVFANGCFDLLHGGHVALLAEARGQGDVLVVGLNSDESVRRLKGPSRPLQSVEDRLRVMAAVRFVDYVTEFEQDTPIDLIMALRPDVIVKGGDYAPENVVGYREAQTWDGRVHIATLIEGLSTTRLIASNP